MIGPWCVTVQSSVALDKKQKPSPQTLHCVKSAASVRLSIMAAEGLTLGVGPVIPYLPHGMNAPHAYAPEGTEPEVPAVTKTFDDTAPEIKELIYSMFGLYTERDPEHLRKLVRRAFTRNAVWDVPIFHVDGADNIATVAWYSKLPFWKVEVFPKLVTVQMLSSELGRIDVVAMVRSFPRRFFPLTLVIPEYIEVHGTWTIVAKGDDDRIMSVIETLHNWPNLPLFVKHLLSFIGSTAGSLLGLKA